MCVCVVCGGGGEGGEVRVCVCVCACSGCVYLSQISDLQLVNCKSEICDSCTLKLMEYCVHGCHGITQLQFRSPTHLGSG